MARERNEWLDVAKLVGAFFVLCIHLGFFWPLNIALNAAARFAVPLFFAVSGFFAVGKNAKSALKSAYKIFILFLVAVAVHLMYYMTVRLFEEGIVVMWQYAADELLDFLDFRDLLLYNLPPTSIHLWFLIALIEVYLIWAVVVKLKLSDTVILILAALTLIIHLTMGEVRSLFGITVEDHYVRNALLMGFPFFSFGYLINRYKHRLVNIPTPYLVIAILLGTAEAITSRFVFGHCELFLGSVFVAFAIMILALRYSHVKCGKTLVRISSTSTDVFIYHIVIADLWYRIIAATLPAVAIGFLEDIKPLVILVLCIGFSLLKSHIKTGIRSRIK